MKQFVMIIIVAMGMNLATTPSTFAQSVEELEAQYNAMLMELIQELQLEIATLQAQQSQLGNGTIITETPIGIANTNLVLGPNQVCEFRYAGFNDPVIIQTELQNQGYAITKIDGKIGPETRAAVMAFQTAVGAAKIDGLIGPETRTLLSRESVACIGDVGVSQSTEIIPVIENNFCSFGYTGNEDIAAIQTELQNQGYAITKIDGKIGPETRAAVTAFQTDVGAAKVDGLIGEETRVQLTRHSIDCGVNPVINTNTSTDTNSTDTTTTTTEATETAVVNEQGNTSGFIKQTEITAAVRSTSSGIPDDTAVFTYRISFNTNSTIYIPTHPEQSFEIQLVDASGNVSNAVGVQSIVSSASKVLREDGTSYFRIANGDTMSLRTSVQPGAGTYYAELSRLSYTNENATTVLNPAMVNYGFDETAWRSSAVTVLN